MRRASPGRCSCARCARAGPRSSRCGGGPRACARSSASGARCSGSDRGNLMARVVAISSDLLLGSKVEGMLAVAGHQVTLSPALAEAPLDEAELIVADLDVENP